MTFLNLLGFAALIAVFEILDIYHVRSTAIAIAGIAVAAFSQPIWRAIAGAAQ